MELILLAPSVLVLEQKPMSGKEESIECDRTSEEIKEKVSEVF